MEEGVFGSPIGTKGWRKVDQGTGTNDSAQYRITIEGMTCLECEHHVTQALLSAGAVDVQASFAHNEAIFATNRTFSWKKAKKALVEAGYHPLNLEEIRGSASNFIPRDGTVYHVHIPGMATPESEKNVRQVLESAGALQVRTDVAQGAVSFRVSANFSWNRAREWLLSAGYTPENIEIEPDRPSRAHFHSHKTYDLLIIGSGSAAFAAAIEAANSGARVAMTEQGVLGGTCVNVGCVPSKSLLRASEVHYMAQSNPFRGLHTQSVDPNWDVVVAEKDRLIAGMRKQKYEDLLAEYHIDFLAGETHFVDRERVCVREQIWDADRYLIATGSKPRIPSIEGLDTVGYWTSATALSMTKRPNHLIVIGSGYIGLELGQLFRNWGSEVTLMQRADTLMPSYDPEVQTAIRDFLQRAGIEVITGLSYQRVIAEGDKKTVYIHDAAVERAIKGDGLLIAAGRLPNTDALNLPAAGVALGPLGEPVVNEYLGTTNPHVYAAGDVTLGPQFVYVAAYEGKLAAKNALGLSTPQALNLRVVPKVTFTRPAIASVGLSEQEAKKQGMAVVSSVLPPEALTRAMVNRETQGLFKLVAEQKTGRLLGAQIVSENAGDVIYAAQLAVQFGLTISDLRDTLAPYLTMAEGLKLTAMAFEQDIKKLSCCAG